MLYGVSAWRKPGIQYTDGMCRRCAATALQEWSARPGAAPRPRLMLSRPRGIAVAAAFLLVALAFTVAGRRDGGGRDAGLSALPRAATGAGPETPREVCD